MTMDSPLSRWPVIRTALWLFLWRGTETTAEPQSRPYIPFRTSPNDQSNKVHHSIVDTLQQQNPSQTSHIHKGYSSSSSQSQSQCPLQFSLGISRRWHEALDEPAIVSPPTIHTVFPALGPGKQVVYTTLYEHLDLLTPAASTLGQKEALVQAPQFPLLWESSAFHAGPILHDVNGDGILDAIVTDYDGGISVMGLAGSGQSHSHLFQHAQVPRLHIRRDWVASRIAQQVGTFNESAHRDPFHSYFEYSYGSDGGEAEKDVVRGVAANALSQDQDAAQALEARRGRRVSHVGDEKTVYEEAPPEEDNHNSQEHHDEHGGSHEEDRILQDLAAEEGAILDQERAHGDPDGEPQQHRRLQEDEEPQQEQPKEEAHDPPADPIVDGTDSVAQDIQKDQPPNTHEQVTDAISKNNNNNNNHTQTEMVTDSASEDLHPEGQTHSDEHHSEQHKFHQQLHQAMGNLDETKHSMAKDHQQLMEGKEKSGASYGGAGRNAVKEEVDLGTNTLVEKEETQQQHPPQAEESNSASKDEGVSVNHVPDRENMKVDQQPNADASNSVPNVDEPNNAQDDGKDVDVDVDQYPTEDDLFNDDRAIADYPRDDDYAMDRELDDTKKTTEEGDTLDGDLDGDAMMDDPYYGSEGMMDDEYRRYADYDDYYGGYNHDDYYDDKHYLRVPPHVLSTPVLAEIPRMYGDQELEDFLLVSASYYFDEDEYEGKFSHKRFTSKDRGDETEVMRGQYVASAILSYTFDGSGRWSAQTHLDLSTDFSAPENITIVGEAPVQADVTKMGAFALASPTVADIDGDKTFEVVVGTSMGLLYVMEARNLWKRDHWPVQFPHAIETKPIVEDVVGNTNLEIFIMDTGGNIACLSAQGEVLWNRNIVQSLGLGSLVSGSPLVLGDIDLDGDLDLVVTANIDSRWFVFAFDAASGQDVQNFPIEFEEARKTKTDSAGDSEVEAIQPLLVDLHSNQDYISEYIRRNSTRFYRSPPRVSGKTNTNQAPSPQGGIAAGLHIVQPINKELYIIEGGTGCVQKVIIGDEVSTMVQVDDIHATNGLDLLVSTESGNVVTLESPAPYHPLNTWSRGATRGRNSHAHGYTASQGVFVHEVSRQFKDTFGVYVPITFEIFDNRPGIEHEPEKRHYKIEIRDGTSSKRVLHRADYTSPGVYTERVYVRYGPGYYNICVLMTSSHGIMYEDCFATGYNVHFLAGFGVLLWLPLVLASMAIFLCGVKKSNWDDEDDLDGDREGGSTGILGRALPT